MKRALCLIIAAIMLLCAAACGEGGTPEDTAPVTEEAGVAVDLHVIFHGEGEDADGRDLSAWDSELLTAHKDESVAKEATVNVLGKDFTGQYSYSAAFYPATHVSHVYTYEYGSFAVNADTGALDSFNAGYEKTEETMSADECSLKALEAAKHFINVDEYRLEVTEGDAETMRPNHVFRWVKYVDETPSADVFSIGISMYGGGIGSIGCSRIGLFDASEANVRAVRRLLNADFEAALKAKIAERFEGVKFDLWIGDVEAICLPDGTPALMVRVEVSRNEVDVADGETYYYPHTSAYDAFVFEGAAD